MIWFVVIFHVIYFVGAKSSQIYVPKWIEFFWPFLFSMQSFILCSLRYYSSFGYFPCAEFYWWFHQLIPFPFQLHLKIDKNIRILSFYTVVNVQTNQTTFLHIIFLKTVTWTHTHIFEIRLPIYILSKGGKINIMYGHSKRKNNVKDLWQAKR